MLPNVLSTVRTYKDWPVTEIDVGDGAMRCGCFFAAVFPAPGGGLELFMTLQMRGFGSDWQVWSLEFGWTEEKSYDPDAGRWRWDRQHEWMERYEPGGAGS